MFCKVRWIVYSPLITLRMDGLLSFYQKLYHCDNITITIGKINVNISNVLNKTACSANKGSIVKWISVWFYRNCKQFFCELRSSLQMIDLKRHTVVSVLRTASVKNKAYDLLALINRIVWRNLRHFDKQRFRNTIYTFRSDARVSSYKRQTLQIKLSRSYKNYSVRKSKFSRHKWFPVNFERNKYTKKNRVLTFHANLFTFRQK